MSAAIAVVGLIIPVLLFVIGRDSKELSVRTKARVELVNLDDPQLRSLELTYGGTKVTRLTAVTVEIENSGTRPLERSDFERDLLIKFPEGTQILAAKPMDYDPPELSPDLTVASNAVGIRPLLLNAGDRFSVAVHLRGGFAEPSIDGRVSGVHAIRRIEFTEDPKSKSIAYVTIAGVVALIALFWFAGYYNPALRNRRFVVQSVDVIVLALVLDVVASSCLGVVVQSLGLSFWMEVLPVAVLIVIVSPVFFIAAKRRRRLNDWVDADQLNASSCETERMNQSTPIGLARKGDMESRSKVDQQSVAERPTSSQRELPELEGDS